MVSGSSRRARRVLPGPIWWPLVPGAILVWLGSRKGDSLAFTPPWRRCSGAFAGGSTSRPSAESSRSWTLIALNGVKRSTKKTKIAQNIVQVRKMGPFQYSSKPWAKEMRKVKKVAEQDAWLNEFMSYSRPMPVGGEYVMPEDMARQHLDEIYGAAPTLDTLVDSLDGEAAVSHSEFRNLNHLRKKKEPSKVGGSRPRRDRIRISNVGGIAKYIGAMPRSKLRDNEQGQDLVGGSLDGGQDVWISGASVSYAFDSDDQVLL